MNTVKTVRELRAAIARARGEGKRIGFVPTMGNLHSGHAALVTTAAQRADFVVASIFVNPLQFGEAVDLGGRDAVAVEAHADGGDGSARPCRAGEKKQAEQTGASAFAHPAGAHGHRLRHGVCRHSSGGGTCRENEAGAGTHFFRQPA